MLTGPPNVGKSSLFNALVERFGAAASSAAIVSPTPGATRDYCRRSLDLDGVACELVDAAGDDGDARDDVDRMSGSTVDGRAAALRRLANCVASMRRRVAGACRRRQSIGAGIVVVLTKMRSRRSASSARRDVVPCSSVTGGGSMNSRRALRAAASEAEPQAAPAAAAATAARARAASRGERALEAAM